MAEYELKVTTTGSAGAATGTATTELPLNGAVWELIVTFHASAPATTTVDVDEVGGASRKILDLAAGNTSASYRPRLVSHSVTGTASSSYSEPFLITGRRVTVTVALSDALTNAVTVTLILLELK